MTSDPIPPTKERLGEYDAIETAKPGEPLFPIQGGDPFGPPTVLHWAQLCRTAALAEKDQEKQARMLDKATAAEEIAWSMQEYQAGHTPADSQGERARYNDAPPSIDNSDEARALRRALIEGVSILHNAEAQAAAVIDALAGLDIHHDQQNILREAVERLRESADQIEPRRANERS